MVTQIDRFSLVTAPLFLQIDETHLLNATEFIQQKRPPRLQSLMRLIPEANVTRPEPWHLAHSGWYSRRPDADVLNAGTPLSSQAEHLISFGFILRGFAGLMRIPNWETTFADRRAILITSERIKHLKTPCLQDSCIGVF